MDLSHHMFGGVRLLLFPCLANVHRLDLGCVPMVVEMNKNGLLIDPAQFAAQSASITLKLQELESSITSTVGRPINPLSGDQVAPLLFRELGLVPPSGRVKLTKTGTRESTEGDILTTLKGQHPIVDLILDYRELSKLKSTYVDTIPKLAWPDGRVRTTLKLTSARTGRMAAESPPLQQIPVRTEDGIKVRYGFVAPKGRKLISLDLSQIEMRIMAHESQDPYLMQVFHDDLDIHTETASAIFRIPKDQVDKMKHRLPAKSASFLTIYEGSAGGLQMYISSVGGPWWELDECQKLLIGWYDTYPGVRDYQQNQHRRALRYGCTWDMFGRPRVVAEVKSALPYIREAGLRQVSNHPIQSGASGIIKLAMAELQSNVVPYFNSYRGEECLPCLQVHDELIFECTDGIVDEFMGMAQYVMESAVHLSVPIKSSAVAGNHWGELKG